MNELLIHKYKPKSIDQLLLSENNKDLLKNFLTNNYYNIIFEGSSGCGKSCLINIILQEYYKGNNKIIESNVCYISLLKDQGINFYKNEVRIFINNCISNSYKKFIVIEDVEFFSDMIQMYFFELIKNHKNNIFFMLTTSNKLKINNNLLHLLDIIKFEQVTYNCLWDILTHILTQEHITIDTNIKKYIIKLSNNSINNLINNVEKIKLLYNNFVSLKDVKELDIESNIVIEHYDELIEYINTSNKREAVIFMLNLINQGYSIIDILENFLYYIKEINKVISEEKKFLIIKLIVNFINNYFSMEEDNIQIIFFTNHLYNILNRTK